jgi:hypothetical protein
MYSETHPGKLGHCVLTVYLYLHWLDHHIFKQAILILFFVYNCAVLISIGLALEMYSPLFRKPEANVNSLVLYV